MPSPLPPGWALLTNVGSDGWLNVRRKDDSTTVALPYMLAVEVGESRDGRQYFTVAEGVYAGQKFSSRENPFDEWARHRPQLTLTFRRGARTLMVPQVGLVSVADQGAELLSVGEYDIGIPDYPHGLKKTQYSTIWFPFGPRAEERYVHVGSYSLGCVTVKDTNRWDSIYKTLIPRRKYYGCVGTLSVVD